MKQYKHIITSICILTTFFGYSQENIEYEKMSKEQATLILIQAKKDSSLHTVIGKTPLLATEEKVISFSEFILFDMYGKKNIESQKPYNVFQIDNHWLISGTLPVGSRGGTFMMIIDSTNCKVILLTHGK